MNKNIKNLILNPLLQMLFAGVLCLSFYDHISDYSARFFLTISVLLREILLFILPFLIFSFISVALSEIRGIFLIFLLMKLIFLSSFFHAFLAGVLGYSLLADYVANTRALEKITELSPLIDFDFIKITDNIASLLAGIFIGILNLYLKNKYINQAVCLIHDLVLKFMNKFFIKFIPLFIGGFLLKLLREGQIANMIGVNIYVFLKLILFLTLYFIFWLFVASKFSWESSIRILKNITPASIVAFSTVSSAAAFPFSLKAAMANTGDKRLIDTVMPVTLSFHLAGDIVLVLVMCMIITVAFNHPLPDVYGFATVATFFVFNQFAGAGVPNATIMVLIPMLRSVWNFDDTMCASAITLYSIVEPISTVGNVTANNLFIILFKNTLGHYFKKRC